MDISGVEKRRILVVDDEPSLLDIMKLLLEGEGYIVEAVSSGEVALDVFQTIQPDLIVSDLRIRGMGGAELCRIIRGKSPSTKIIIFSAMPYDSKYFDHQGHSYAPDAYLRKPASGAVILAAVKKALNTK